MITITESAAEKILELFESKGLVDHALRIAITGRGPAGFMYQLQFLPQENQADDDESVDAGSFRVLIDPETAQNLKGSTLEFIDEISARGFNIENPNPLWTDPLALSIQEVLDTRINPAVAGHGGYVSLLDVQNETAFIALGGGCQGCGLADVTLKQGIEVMIKENIPQITRVIDSTDHASGQNPYYQPSKGGESPLAQN
jgi:Fe/S biogenesis protein NfuA